MNHYQNILDKIVNHDTAKGLVSLWQSNNNEIVFTNGCFDILHRGHVEYLAKAASLGHKLVLGLNTDNSVSRIKGPLRPVVDQNSRAVLLAALGFIDLVVFFDEETPYELIKLIQPDILVKGSDYKPESIVGYDIVTEKGGRVETIDFVDGFSTTSLIEKIKKGY
ncbi:MAG: D-glycero-beta-D-manno-heptose 1-phosphate adenylyltransferase [Breznakibacter sp.]|jgi:rfaE bifunctional protein nucleotidyltransferase chain/domain|nr:D-glycero-beta-D-manno-heptose 1-phosphate adenylyltransferase [Breznakibacter sp.]